MEGKFIMDIKLRKLHYSEWEDNPEKNQWELKGLSLDDQNLIVGKNAVGKSRTIRVIHNLANIISQKTQLLDGHWDIEFDIDDNNNKTILKYELKIKGRKIIKEILRLNQANKLIRNAKTYVYSETSKKQISIDPPSNKLVLHIRRDATEYRFFEYLIRWSESLFGYTSSQIKSDVIVIPKAEENLVSLNTVPTVFDLLNPDSIKQIIGDFNTIGYELEHAKTEIAQGKPFDIKLIHIKEKNLKHFINQIDMSDGMFKTFALLTITQYLINKKIASTILVDDLCEGLDYDRSSKFSKLLYEKMKRSNIQFIATTNDSFLMNSVPIEYWNILKREGSTVFAYNYKNNKKSFDEFKLIGLSNFDIFSSNILSELKIK